MDSMIAEKPPTDEDARGIVPRTVLLSVGDHMCEALLVAATEGTTRFVAGAPGDPWRPGEQVESALQLLAEQCGLPLGIEDVEAVILHGRPLQTVLVGERDDADRAPLHGIERDGIARIHRSFDAPRRGASRIADWVRGVVAAIDGGDYEAMIVLLPSGSLPTWAAQLLNALSVSDARLQRDIFIIATGASLASALPLRAQHIERNGDLPHALGDALLSLHSRLLLPDSAASRPIISSVQAVASAVVAARQEASEMIVYLDVGLGSIVIIAHPQGVAVLHDPECDAASGAVGLLQRVGAEEVARWIPIAVDTETLRAWAIRRISASAATLTDARDRAIASGFAVAALRALIAKAAGLPAPTRCLVGSSLLRLASPSDAMHIVADVLPASTIVEIAADTDGLLPVVGYLATHSPDAARSLLAHDTLMPLGTLLTVPSGRARGESVVAALVMGKAGASRTAIVEGVLTTIRARSTDDVNIIRRDGREEAITVHGGPCGVLVDTRARPLTRGGKRRDARGTVSDRLRVDLSKEGADRG